MENIVAVKANPLSGGREIKAGSSAPYLAQPDLARRVFMLLSLILASVCCRSIKRKVISKCFMRIDDEIAEINEAVVLTCVLGCESEGKDESCDLHVSATRGFSTIADNLQTRPMGG